MTAKKRIIAFAVVFAMVFTMAFSVLFIVHEAEHKCTGVDCQVCVLINNCIRLLDNNTPKPESFVFAVSLVFALIIVIGAVRYFNSSKSLISLKIKLSN